MRILWINMVVFSIVALVHLVRSLMRWNFQINGWDFPIILSLIASIVGLTLVWLNYRALEQ